MFLLVDRQHPTGGDAVPFGEAAPAASGSSVLRQECWVPAKRRLLAVVCRMRRCKAMSDEDAGVREDGLLPPDPHVFPLARGQRETLSEGRTRQPDEDVVQVPH